MTRLMDGFIDSIEWIAALFIGVVAADIFISVLLRYFFGIQKLKSDSAHEVYSLTPQQLDAWKKAAEPLEKAWADGVKKAGGDADAIMKELKAALAKFNASM